ncbi:MAG TPA: hypothetical protein VD866_16265 [Urbifossiella sp.]|nr:hypothetical protein [Urbifossiella sp.]
MLMYYDRFVRDLERSDLGPFVCLALVVGFILWVGLLATIARVLGRVSPENRRMEPGEVWVNLIPVVNLVWPIVTVERVGESIRAELAARNRVKKADAFGKTSGIIALVLVGVFFVLAPAAVVTFPFAFLYGIIYWVQLNGYARRMTEAPREPVVIDEGW